MYDRLYNSFVQQQRYSYGDKIPSNFDEFTNPCQQYTNSTTFNFTGNYRQRQSTAWCPDTRLQADPPLMIQSTQIYHRHIGQLPYFGGHIPGAQFRFGKTFGTDSKDAKRWLRGDFAI